MEGEIRTALDDIGLTEYQSRAYVAAVGLGTARLPALADEADIPQQRIYDVVDDLKKLGLIEVHEESDGKKAVAVPPEHGLTELKRQRVDEFESSVDDAIDALNRQFEQVDSSLGFVTVVNHESSVRRHVATAVESAEWWLFLSLSLEWYRDFQADIRDAVERGATVRVLVQADDPGAVEDAPFLDGLSVRYRPSADVLVAADREYGVFRGVAAPAVPRPSLVTRDGNIVEMFQRYSEQFWTASRKIRSENPHPRRYLEPWRAINDHADLLDAGERLEAHVEGHDTDTGRAGTWRGTIVDYELEAEREADYSVVIPEVARIVVETGGERLTVGGWDATLEDVAASALEIRRP